MLVRGYRVYILNKSCISRIPLAYCSLEKEVFPRMAAEGKLFCWKLSGYWGTAPPAACRPSPLSLSSMPVSTNLSCAHCLCFRFPTRLLPCLSYAFYLSACFLAATPFYLSACSLAETPFYLSACFLAATPFYLSACFLAATPFYLSACFLAATPFYLSACFLAETPSPSKSCTEADIGQPKDFLRGMSLFLEDLRVNRETRERKETPASGSLPEENLSKDDSLEDCAECPGLICMPSQELALVDGPQFVGNVLVDPSAVIGEGSILGPNVTVDKDVIIGRGCRLKNCALMRGVHISDFSWIDSSIVGWQSSVGKWVRVEGLTVVGENVHLLDECFINGAFILPHKTITESISESGAIIM
ncbi:GTP-D-mannose [Cyclospora cayetanensis]|uniref:GTP-D-mannose n=1 Tax=Cyclospora cayetanensis TaxID=88456 RepID=A0A1D3D5A4_9EIME|nr:GTP-D-mannose [Cyclospora cayetanensis]